MESFKDDWHAVNVEVAENDVPEEIGILSVDVRDMENPIFLLKKYAGWNQDISFI